MWRKNAELKQLVDELISWSLEKKIDNYFDSWLVIWIIFQTKLMKKLALAEQDKAFEDVTWEDVMDFFSLLLFFGLMINGIINKSNCLINQ